MNTNVTVNAQAVYVLIRYMQSESLENELLSKRLDAALKAERIPIDEWWSLLEMLERLHPISGLGIRIGQMFHLKDIGVLGYLVASCGTLAQALYRIQRFQPLLHNQSFSWTEAKSGALRLCWNTSVSRSTPLSNEVFIAGLLCVLSKLVAPHEVIPLGITFRDSEPEGIDEYQALLGCDVGFACPQVTVTISASDLELPINSQDPLLLALMDQQAEALLATAPQPDDFLKELQRYMLQGLEEGQLSMEWLSERLDIPLRSLYRALQLRRKTYKELLDDMRLQLAKRYLTDPAISLTEIALMLGYSEHSAFTRAFKTWTGQTPLRHRRQLHTTTGS
jgi:AraC-like DNA-binding protein